MIELHIWGYDEKVSVISPESLACSWLANIVYGSNKKSFNIVTSNNTNIAAIDRLPVLITEENKKYHGYESISRYLTNESSISDTKLNNTDELTNSGLMNLYQSKLEIIHQFNLFINSINYEKYTRKLFKEYFPFPMMYNQPLKFYNNAQELVRSAGLQGSKPGFFSFTGADKTAQTEYFNDDSDDDDFEDQIAISALHERSMMAKSKQNILLKEGKRNIKCLHLLEEILSQALQVREKNTLDTTLSTSDLLLCAYVYSMVHEDLTDRFLHNYLKVKFGSFLESCNNRIEMLNTNLYSDKSIFRGPIGTEIPSFTNEIAYSIGMVKY